MASMAGEWSGKSAAEVMEALCPRGEPADGVEIDQQWGSGHTTVKFRDGSSLLVTETRAYESDV